MNVELATFGNHSWFNGSKRMLTNQLNFSLNAQFIQKWQSEVNNSNKRINYRIYKTKHKFEQFFELIEVKHLRFFINFRLCNHHLPIERGRWLRQDVSDRKCHLCNCNEVGDEFHHIFKYSVFNNGKNTLLPTKLCRNPNIFTFQNLMNTKNKIKFNNFM